ncbi:BrnT family toxin [Psychrobacter submarinus]|uniref:BrnT family toxin n=1 Tax=Psychrobacter submarinus TaxID=154108 RepID=UPI0019198D78|nr:BrnT family toxin [Psychrobacter submarinus]
MSITFEWDEQKNIINQRKHRLSFEAATRVFLDPLCLRQQDRYENGEERWQALGTVDGTAVLLVAHTQTDIDGGEIIRIISARRATKIERRLYEQG